MKLLLTVALVSVTAFAEPMSSAEFCAAVKAKATALKGQCDPERRQTQTTIKMIDLSLENDSCERYLSDVEIDAALVPACLDLIDWNTPDIANLDEATPCRLAIKGRLAVGAKCFFDLQCPAGSECAPKPGGEVFPSFCSPPIKKGTPCMDGAGSTCGAAFVCTKGKCQPRPKRGAACNPKTQTCAEGLTCLAKKAGTTKGTCGPARKDGEACHRWTECRGICLTSSEDVEDGVCASECGSK